MTETTLDKQKLPPTEAQLGVIRAICLKYCPDLLLEAVPQTRGEAGVMIRQLFNRYYRRRN